MKTNDLYASPWLRGEDLVGKSYTLTISNARMQTFKSQNGGADETKIVLAFSNAKKELILNRMQHTALCEIANSDDTDDWEGLSIVVSKGMTPQNKATVVLTAVPEAAGEKKMTL